MNYTNDIFVQKLPTAICIFCQRNIEDGRKTASMIRLKCEHCSSLHQIKISFLYSYFDKGYYLLECIVLKNNDWEYQKSNHNTYSASNYLVNENLNQEYYLPSELCLTPLDFEKIDNILLLL